MPLPRTMTSKVCGDCRRTIFVNENGSLYEDVTRHRYHTRERCLAIQLQASSRRIDGLTKAIELYCPDVKGALSWVATYASFEE